MNVKRFPPRWEPGTDARGSSEHCGVHGCLPRGLRSAGCKLGPEKAAGGRGGVRDQVAAGLLFSGHLPYFTSLLPQDPANSPPVGSVLIGCSWLSETFSGLHSLDVVTWDPRLLGSV